MGKLKIKSQKSKPHLKDKRWTPADYETFFEGKHQI